MATATRMSTRTLTSTRTRTCDADADADVDADADGYPPAGWADGACAVPAEAQAVDTSSPDTVVGDRHAGELHGETPSSTPWPWAASSPSTAVPTR